MNTDKLTAFVKKHGIKFAIVGGGGVLLATNYGSCELTPAPEEVAIPDVEEVESVEPDEELTEEPVAEEPEAEEPVDGAEED